MRDQLDTLGIRTTLSTGSAVVCILAATALVVASGMASAHWDPWPSPNGNDVADSVEPLDQTSGGPDPTNALASRGDLVDVDDDDILCTVGQTFRPGMDTLYRVDLMIDNHEDYRPAQIRIGEVAASGHPSSTTAEWEEPVPMTGSRTAGGFRRYTFFPRLDDIDTEKDYYIEIVGTGRDNVRVGREGSTDPYGYGFAWECSDPASGPIHMTYHQNLDLWFRTYGEPSGDPPDAPQPVASEALPWFEPLESTGVDRYSYRARVEGYADAWMGLQNPDPKKWDELAWHYAALYRGSLEDDYVDNARVALAGAYTYRFQGGGAALSWNDPGVGLAYRLLGNHPDFTDDERNQAKCVMIDAGIRIWNEGVKLGADGLSLATALNYFLTLSAWDGSSIDECTTESASAPRGDWEAYAQEVWDYFWCHRDLTADSSNYLDNNSLATLAALASIQDVLPGSPNVMADESIRGIVDRTFNQIAPIGVNGNFGENNGLGYGQTGLIWLFEKAAVEYDDPNNPGLTDKYRWLANRIYEYDERRLCGSTATGDALGPSNNMGYLASAYAEGVDGSAEPPAAQKEIPDAQQTSDEGSDPPTSNKMFGQTFQFSHDRLVRFDAQLGNGGNSSAVRVRIFKWNNNLQDTIKDPPLYDDSIQVPSASPTLVSVYPFLELTPGLTYFVLLDRPITFTVRSSEAGEAYDGGDLWVGGRMDTESDMWFSSWSLTDDGSTYTKRRKSNLIPVADRPDDPDQSFEFCEDCPSCDVCDECEDCGTCNECDSCTETVPDKLVLRSGYHPSALHAMFNLTVSGFEHGDWSPGSLSLLVDEGSVIMGETGFPYFFHNLRTQGDENGPIARRYWGGNEEAAFGNATTVDRFVDYRRATVAWVSWPDVHGWGITQQRRFYFVKDRFLWIRDGFTFDDVTGASLGALWHVADVETGPDSQRYEVSWRQPLGANWEYRNSEHYATLYFVPRDGAHATSIYEPSYDYPKDADGDPICTVPGCDEHPANMLCGHIQPDCRHSPAYIAYQRWNGEGQPGETIWLDTVIVPHASTAEEQLPDIDVLVAGASCPPGDLSCMALRVTVDGERWTLVDSPANDPLDPNPNPIDVSGLHTDAAYLIARTSEPTYLMTHAASYVVVDDPLAAEVDEQWNNRTSAELLPDCPETDTCSDTAGCEAQDPLIASPFHSCRDAGNDVFSCPEDLAQVSYCGPKDCCQEDPACPCFPELCPEAESVACTPLEDEMAPDPDSDADGDGLDHVCDNCPDEANAGQSDIDGDGVGDACDNCVWVANPAQFDGNGNGVGELCECLNDGDCDDGDPCTDDLCLLPPQFPPSQQPGQCKIVGECP